MIRSRNRRALRGLARGSRSTAALRHSLLLSVRVTALCVLTACASAGRGVQTPSGLHYRVIARGSGPQAQPGQQVSIHETTSLPSGAIIYTSRGGAPISFRLGAGQVITGVDEGVTGMRVGERRLLIVPPTLSRRTSYPSNTPADSTLHIDVEVVQIAPVAGR